MELEQPLFLDRGHAGRLLASHLDVYMGRPGLLVLALPRGGVAVGLEVARVLQATLDIFVVRKLGFPGHEEYAMGAIASGGARVMNPLPGRLVTAHEIQAAVEREQLELVRREQFYRSQRPAVAIRGRTVIVVDDGMATGSTMQAALLAIRQQQPLHVVAAVPVGTTEGCESLGGYADDVVCAVMPTPFGSVGRWYQDFAQVSDDEVCRHLDAARSERMQLLRSRQAVVASR